jgi:hypothetical protein
VSVWTHWSAGLLPVWQKTRWERALQEPCHFQTIMYVLRAFPCLVPDTPISRFWQSWVSFLAFPWWEMRPIYSWNYELVEPAIMHCHQLSGLFYKVPVRLLGTRFTNATSCFKPRPQEPYRDIFWKTCFTSIFRS